MMAKKLLMHSDLWKGIFDLIAKGKAPGFKINSVAELLSNNPHQ